MMVLGKLSHFLGQDTLTNISCNKLLLTSYTSSSSEHVLSLHRSMFVSRELDSVQ